MTGSIISASGLWQEFEHSETCLEVHSFKVLKTPGGYDAYVGVLRLGSYTYNLEMSDSTIQVVNVSPELAALVGQKVILALKPQYEAFRVISYGRHP